MRTNVVISLIFLALTAAPLWAGQSADILRITGQIEGGAADFDIAELRDLPETTIETATVVTDGPHSFTGVLMRDLLDRLGANGDHVIATALNDYVVDIPISDFDRFDVIVAYEMDGEALDRADKGPLWIVYPRDDHTELQDIRYDYRWVWQLSGLDVK